MNSQVDRVYDIRTIGGDDVDEQHFVPGLLNVIGENEKLFLKRYYFFTELLLYSLEKLKCNQIRPNLIEGRFDEASNPYCEICNRIESLWD